MFPRHSQILHTITQEGKVDIGRLAELCGVSQVTVRKDLTALEERGLIRRQHGFAKLNAEHDINNRLAIHYEEKSDLAKRAAEFIDDGEVIFIESGSCCALLAEYINRIRKNVTMITYSAFIATQIQLTNGNQIILLGGVLVPESKVTVGPMTIDAIANFSVDKFFTGTDGITPDWDFTAKDLMLSEVIKAMARRCKKIIVLTDSSKFQRQGTVTIFPVSSVYAVYTDWKCPPEIRDYLAENNVILNSGENPEQEVNYA